MWLKIILNNSLKIFYKLSINAHDILKKIIDTKYIESKEANQGER